MRHSRGVADTLTAMASMWATPTANDHTGAQTESKSGGKLRRRLQTDAALFPAPAARDCRSPNLVSYQDRSGTTKGEQLPNFVERCFRPDPTPPTSGDASSSNTPISRLRLSPAFVCWLMGWPTWWTHPEHHSSAQRVTEWSRWRQASLSTFSYLKSAYREA